jgi:3,4-dihydroxy 2-butanone 4-phosphate synthase / GTP cyclohydrolase II
VIGATAELVRAVLATSNGAPRAHRVHGMVLHLGVVPLDTVHGRFAVHLCQNLFTRGYVLLLARGDITTAEPVLARVHSSCVTSESYGSCDCDCAEQLDGALAAIAAAGRGALFYLMQEGRGAGFAAKARDRMLVQASRDRLTTFDAYERMGLGNDHRQYDEVAFARGLLHVTAPLTVLTNNPEKVESLARVGVPIAGTVPLQHTPSPFNLHYLAAKSASGHRLDVGDGNGGGDGVELPEIVETFTPYAEAGMPHLVRIASYLLPIVIRDGAAARDAPHWFRLHAYFDAAASIERVVLSYDDGRGAVPLVRVQRESLLDRFSPAGGGETRPAWNAVVQAFVAHGAGVAVMVAGDADRTAALLLARHAAAASRGGNGAHGAAQIQPLVDGGAGWDTGGVVASELAGAGIVTAPPLELARR